MASSQTVFNLNIYKLSRIAYSYDTSYRLYTGISICEIIRRAYDMFINCLQLISISSS